MHKTCTIPSKTLYHCKTTNKPGISLPKFHHGTIHHQPQRLTTTTHGILDWLSGSSTSDEQQEEASMVPLDQLPPEAHGPLVRVVHLSVEREWKAPSVVVGTLQPHGRPECVCVSVCCIVSVYRTRIHTFQCRQSYCRGLLLGKWRCLHA